MENTVRYMPHGDRLTRSRLDPHSRLLLFHYHHIPWPLGAIASANNHVPYITKIRELLTVRCLVPITNRIPHPIPDMLQDRSNPNRESAQNSFALVSAFFAYRIHTPDCFTDRLFCRYKIFLLSRLLSPQFISPLTTSPF